MTAPTFLPDDKIANAIKELIRESKTLKIAVAYWGKGAIEGLGLKKPENKNKDVKILCDLMSGGSNPAEIEELQKIPGKYKIKHLDNLHAKIWIGDDAVIIGSSNASANGQGWEGRETKGLIEVNGRIDDAKFLKKSNEWFDKQWDEGQEIDKRMLKEAKENWKKRIINKQTTSFHNYEIVEDNLILLTWIRDGAYSTKPEHKTSMEDQVGEKTTEIEYRINNSLELEHKDDEKFVTNKWIIEFKITSKEKISKKHKIKFFRTSHALYNCFSYDDGDKETRHVILNEEGEKWPPLPFIIDPTFEKIFKEEITNHPAIMASEYTCYFSRPEYQEDLKKFWHRMKERYASE